MEKTQNQGEILVDKNSRGKDRNWRGRKVLSLRLADIFKEVNGTDITGKTLNDVVSMIKVDVCFEKTLPPWKYSHRLS